MSRRPSHPVRLMASALAASALLDHGGLLGRRRRVGGGLGHRRRTGPRRQGGRREGRRKGRGEEAAHGLPATSPTGSPTASPSALTESGAKAALLTEADLEGGWNQVQDADKWRDRLLVGEVDVSDFLTAKTDAADCQRLLDGLYRDNLLGEPSGPSALTGFEQGDSRLLEQVAAYDRAGLDDSLTWMGSLPQKCDQFTATDEAGEKRTVQVTEASVPEVGDAREGLHVTVRGTTADNPATLTLDLVAVRVGTSALTVTGGGLDGDEAASVEQAVRQGTERLKTVLDGGDPFSAAHQPGLTARAPPPSTHLGRKPDSVITGRHNGAGRTAHARGSRDVSESDPVPGGRPGRGRAGHRTERGAVRAGRARSRAVLRRHGGDRQGEDRSHREARLGHGLGRRHVAGVRHVSRRRHDRRHGRPGAGRAVAGAGWTPTNWHPAGRAAHRALGGTGQRARGSTGCRRAWWTTAERRGSGHSPGAPPGKQERLKV